MKEEKAFLIQITILTNEGFIYALQKSWCKNVVVCENI